MFRARNLPECSPRRNLGPGRAFREAGARRPEDHDARRTMTPELAFVDDLPVAAFAVDPAGRVVRHNAAAAALWGRSPDPGARWSGAWRLLDAGGAPLAPEATPAARTLAEGRPPPVAVLFAERPDGGRAAFASRPALLHDAEGRVAGVLELMLEAPEVAAELAPELAAPEPADLAAARLAAIVSSSDDAIVGKTLEGRVTSWNDGAMRIFGWSAEEMVGQSITRIIPPELHPEEVEILARLRRGERIEHFDTERVTKDGRRISVSLTVSPIRDASGRVVGASKIARDVSARKRAEATQRQLVEELNHRVKNTLATIQAIAAQSLRRSPGPEAFVRSFGGRVQALARVHELLVAGDLVGAELAAILAAELAAGGEPADALRVAAEGPAVMLEPRIAVQMALVLHELVENARRHGALAAPGGRVAVGWHVAAGPDGQRLRLGWREQGGPPAPAGAGAGGFGFALIERSLVANGGTATRTLGDDGLAWEIGLPLPELPAALPPPAAEARLPAALAPAELAGRRVLVVEDEPLVALEIETELVEAGATVVGPVGTIEAAARLIEDERLDAALLDANLGGRPVDALATALAARGVPFAFASGYGPAGLPAGFRERPLIGKPFGAEALVALVAGLLAPADDATVVPLRPRD
jgi:PAS domain S-box-containing protein